VSSGRSTCPTFRRPRSLAIPSRARTLDHVLPEYYDELRAVAGRMLRAEAPGHTLQPTALAHEACVRLSQRRSELIRQRAYFMNCAVDVIRKVLIDHARRRQRVKRGRGWTAVSLEGLLAPVHPVADLLTLHEALEELRALNDRHARVVELRFFAGLYVVEVAATLGVSPRTVKSDWRMARAWLGQRLAEDPNARGPS